MGRIAVPVLLVATVSAIAQAGPDLSFATTRPVPHGRVKLVDYPSKSLNVPRRANVYTPPGYESSPEKLPVLYLLHGSGDDETGWVVKGSANTILDNLLAEGSARPMIVVMPYGYAQAAGTPRPSAQSVRNASPEDRARRNEAFANDLLKDLIPFVESHYRVAADREHRALAGLSMGGGQTLRIGMSHPETFACIAAFSSSVPTADLAKDYPNFFSDPAATNRQMKLVWISCGDKDRGLEAARKLSETLTERGVHNTWHEDKGAHEWPVWKADLHAVAPLLFRD